MIDRDKLRTLPARELLDLLIIQFNAMEKRVERAESKQINLPLNTLATDGEVKKYADFAPMMICNCAEPLTAIGTHSCLRCTKTLRTV